MATADCVKAIIDSLQHMSNPNLTDAKNWKRRSKREAYGSVYRVFENIKTGDKVVTEEENGEITVKPCYPSLFALLRDVISHMDYVANYSILHQLHRMFVNLPNIKDEDGNEEEVDFENNEIYKITDSSIEFMAGGDWQNPLDIVAELKDGALVVTSYKNRSDDYEEGMSMQQILETVYGAEIPKELKEKVNSQL